MLVAIMDQGKVLANVRSMNSFRTGPCNPKLGLLMHRTREREVTKAVMPKRTRIYRTPKNRHSWGHRQSRRIKDYSTPVLTRNDIHMRVTFAGCHTDRNVVTAGAMSRE